MAGPIYPGRRVYPIVRKSAYQLDVPKSPHAKAEHWEVIATEVPCFDPQHTWTLIASRTQFKRYQLEVEKKVCECLSEQRATNRPIQVRHLLIQVEYPILLHYHICVHQSSVQAHEVSVLYWGISKRLSKTCFERFLREQKPCPPA